MNRRITYAGFTVVELMVGVSVFLVAATVISGVFVRAIRTQRQASEIMVSASDAGLILERMAREIRSGYDFTIVETGSSCSPGDPSLAAGTDVCFRRYKGSELKTVTYAFDAASGALVRDEDGTGGRLNSDKTSVERLTFTMVSEDPWRLTIVLWTKPADPQTDYTARLQTTVAARILPEETTSP